MNIYKDRSSSEETRVDTNDPANASSRLDLCKQIDPPPVFRLYPDLCSDIFIECLSSNSWRNKEEYMSPLALSHVCSSWRNIAWTTPRLWNAIQLDLNGIRREHVVLVVEWLLRSGALPLSIFAYADLCEPSSAASAVLDIITLHAERWSRVAFDFPRHYYYPLYKAEGRLHTIQYLELPLDSGARNVNMDIFSVAPRLHHVFLRISDDYDYDIVQTFVLPLDQLTKLSVECDNLEKCIRILQLCPQVIECTFYSELPWCTVTTPLLYTGRLESLRLCAFRTQLSFYFGHLNA